MKMLVWGFVAMLGMSSAVHAGPVSGLGSQELGYQQMIRCPIGQIAAPIYNSNGAIIGWRCARDPHPAGTTGL